MWLSNSKPNLAELSSSKPGRETVMTCAVSSTNKNKSLGRAFAQVGLYKKYDRNMLDAKNGNAALEELAISKKCSRTHLLTDICCNSGQFVFLQIGCQ